MKYNRYRGSTLPHQRVVGGVPPGPESGRLTLQEALETPVVCPAARLDFKQHPDNVKEGYRKSVPPLNDVIFMAPKARLEPA